MRENYYFKQELTDAQKEKVEEIIEKYMINDNDDYQIYSTHLIVDIDEEAENCKDIDDLVIDLENHFNSNNIEFEE